MEQTPRLSAKVAEEDVFAVDTQTWGPGVVWNQVSEAELVPSHDAVPMCRACLDSHQSAYVRRQSESAQPGDGVAIQAAAGSPLEARAAAVFQAGIVAKERLDAHDARLLEEQHNVPEPVIGVVEFYLAPVIGPEDATFCHPCRSMVCSKFAGVKCPLCLCAFVMKGQGALQSQ